MSGRLVGLFVGVVLGLVFAIVLGRVRVFALCVVLGVETVFISAPNLGYPERGRRAVSERITKSDFPWNLHIFIDCMNFCSLKDSIDSYAI